MTRRFEKVAVLGLGLLGGSVALAARERGLAACVAGASRRREVLDSALERGAIDEAAGYEGAVSGADLIVLATPVFAMSRVAGYLAHWREQMTDNRIFRPTQVFVGGHDAKYTPLELR